MTVPRTSLTLLSPVCEFLTEKFYQDCIEINATKPRLGFGLPEPTDFELDLRDILALQWLTLRMTDEEIMLKGTRGQPTFSLSRSH